VRVLDLFVRLPDFRPLPRVVEETSGDRPQRVAFDDRVRIRMVGTQVIRVERKNGCAEQDSSQYCKRSFKHGG
jgi:hypothetical protein